MFKRYAMSVINLIDTKGNKRVAFEDSDKKVVSFEYDPENFVYFRCRAISADVPNGNGDFFSEEELRKAYKTFIGVGMYKDHDSDSVDKSVGKVLWAEWVPDGKYVECYCCVDKKLEPELARRIEMGQANTVSMGCMVGEAICSVCNNVAHNQMELCSHMIPGRGIKGKKTESGKTAYEINKLLQFTELSLVTVPADPTAHIFEVYAKLQSGNITVDEFRAALRDEFRSVISEMSSGRVSSVSTSTNSNSEVAISSGPANTAVTVSASPSVTELKTVANIPDSTEEQMKLAISYERGENLTNSFFVAKEASAEFRVAASDVLPLIVQEAIRTKQPGVATPAQIVADLGEKCPSLADFKKWAKKRKKKNRRAMDKLNKNDEAAEGKKEEAAPSAENALPTTASPAPAPAAEAAPAPAAAAPANDVLDPAPVSDAPAADAGQPGDAHTDDATNDLAGLTKEEIQQTIEMLTNHLNKLQSSLNAKKAVKTQENVVDKRDNGTSSSKPSTAKNPSAINEIAKTESPKGHIEKGAAIVATAEAKEPLWSLNMKELEKKPAVKKPAQAAPTDVSWDSKEMASEQLKPEKGGNAGSAVKKYFGRLPSGGLGEAPKALDLKSNKDPEKEVLRKRAEEAEKEAARLKEKERLAALADKIYEIVKALREKNVVTAEKEDEVINHLSSSFKDLAGLDAVLGLVTRLAASEPTQATPEAGESISGGVPQVFEPISETEDAISQMSKIWNL